jgi:ribonuclease E
VDWAELGPEPGPEIDQAGELGAEELPPREGGRPDGPRRRRRRRGRRRDRPGLESPIGAGTSPVDEFDEDLDDDEVDAPPPSVPQSRRPEAPPKHAPRTPVEDDVLVHEFDFGDDEDVEPFDDEDELQDDIQDRVGVAVEPDDDEIDPGLEEEIRREVEEIAELEREMGLRGTTEARPRRGDDREVEPGGRMPRGRGPSKPPLQEIFRRGDEVLVQVIKESIGTKGPTLSTYISIPGRYLVLMPGLNRVGVSRKIADEGQRRKLREIMNDLNPPKGLGFIVRTAGLERTKRELARDLAYLLRLWKVILRRIKKAKTPAPIYQESDMITRTIRDIFTAEIDTIWIDEPAAFERAKEFLQVVMPRFVNRLKLYEERVPLFHKYGIEDEIAKIQRRHVPLPQGGSIVIDQTEALVAIDVNSGNFRVENDAERTAYEMNLKAAKEIARQLRLRDLGGVIVNDFIDMREERHRRGVEKAMRDAIKRDRARTKVLRMSAFGLIEMTRQRIRPSLKRSVYEDCSHCAGAGVVKTVESMSIDVMRLLALASHREDIRRVNVSVSPTVATYLNNRKRSDLARLEHDYNMTILIRPEENMPAEHLQIDCFDGNNGEIRLLPAPTPAHRRAH